MKSFIGRLKLWYRLGKNCRSCCLFCKWFSGCRFEIQEGNYESYL